MRYINLPGPEIWRKSVHSYFVQWTRQNSNSYDQNQNVKTMTGGYENFSCTLINKSKQYMVE